MLAKQNQICSIPRRILEWNLRKVLLSGLLGNLRVCLHGALLVLHERGLHRLPEVVLIDESYKS